MVRYLLLVYISPQCEVSVFQRLMTGILTKKEWQCPLLHIQLVTGSFDERVDKYPGIVIIGILERKVYAAFQKHRLSSVFHYALLVLQLGIFLLEMQFHLT